jgi:hypothetical protein
MTTCSYLKKTSSLFGSPDYWPKPFWFRLTGGRRGLDSFQNSVSWSGGYNPLADYYDKKGLNCRHCGRTRLRRDVAGDGYPEEVGPSSGKIIGSTTHAYTSFWYHPCDCVGEILGAYPDPAAEAREEEKPRPLPETRHEEGPQREELEMPQVNYAAFEVKSINYEGQTKRGIQAKCGFSSCDRTETIMVNTMRRTGTGDEDLIEKSIAQKFEKTGWKIGKNPTQNRCPACFTAIKAANKRKAQEVKPEPTTSPMQVQPPPRNMTRDERYLITKKIDEFYVNDKVGYMTGWNDKKIAEDLGVPVGFVASVREDTFGPNIDEYSTQVMEEAKGILDEIKAIRLQVEEMIKPLKVLVEQADRIEKKLTGLEAKK